MSTSLYWKPCPKQIVAGGAQLKNLLVGRLWPGQGDGDAWAPHGEIEVDEGLIPYLEGLADAGVQGARELAGVIGLLGRIILWIA